MDGDIGKTSAGPGKGNVNTSILPFWLLTLQQKVSTIHTILCHSTLQTVTSYVPGYDQRS